MQKKKEEMSKEEQIGFHKGSLQTLVGERNELIKMIQITETLMQAHIQALQKLGVKIPTSEPQKKQGKEDNAFNLEDKV